METLARIEEHVRRHELIPPGGEVTCLVSGGADSTCLWHALGALGYRVSALHVNHGLRGAESEEDARFCRELMGAEVVEVAGPARTEAELRDLRYAVAADRLRATGHTASDQVETVLYRLATSGTTRGHQGEARGRRRAPAAVALARGDRGVLQRGRARPGEPTRRTPTPCAASSATSSCRSCAASIRPPRRTSCAPLEERRLLPPELGKLLDAPVGSKRVDLGGGVQVVREYDGVWLERSPVALDGEVEWGGWRIASELPGLRVRSWRPGDRLAGRTKKIQDVFVDAKIPRSERETWPLVVRGDDVVAVPGIVEAPGVRRCGREQHRARRMASARS